MKKLIAVVLVILVVLAGVFWVFSGDVEPPSDTQQTEVSDQMRADYQSLPENHKFIKQNSDETIERFEQGTGVIFLGFKQCPWCQKLVPILNEAAEAEGVNIYYLDILADRQGNTPAYQRLVSILEPYLAKDEDGHPRIGVPDVSLVKDGEIIWRHEMEDAGDDESTPDTYWTTERRQRAIANFREQVQAIK